MSDDMKYCSDCEHRCNDMTSRNYTCCMVVRKMTGDQETCLNARHDQCGREAKFFKKIEEDPYKDCVKLEDYIEVSKKQGFIRSIINMLSGR